MPNPWDDDPIVAPAPKQHNDTPWLDDPISGGHDAGESWGDYFKRQASYAPGMARSAVEHMPVVGPYLDAFANQMNARTNAFIAPILSGDSTISHAPTYDQRYDENLKRESQALPQFEQQNPGAASVGEMIGYGLGSAPALAAVPATLPALAATSGGIAGADTLLARKGTVGQAVTDALLGAGTSVAGSSVGKLVGATAKQFTPQLYQRAVRPATVSPSGRPEILNWEGNGIGPLMATHMRGKLPEDWWQVAPHQERAAEKFAANNPYIRLNPNPIPHDKVQAIGTGIGAGLGYAFGLPELAFVGYGTAPGIASMVSKATPSIAKYAEPATMSPTTQAIIQALQHKATEDVKK